MYYCHALPLSATLLVSPSSGKPLPDTRTSGVVSCDSLGAYLHRFHRGHVLVIGDVMLDHYIWGAVSRISPEAPVPVVHVERESVQLGGAANVYNNVLSTGWAGRSLWRDWQG